MEKTTENLTKHVYTLSHMIGNRSVEQIEELNQAANYIDEQFCKFGYPVERQYYRISDEANYEPFCMDEGNGDTESVEVCNIIATKIGMEYPDEIMIIGAHYDTCENPGADDNASGIAGILEIARLLSGIPTKRTIKFIAFTCEEPPAFHTEQMGSLVYAKDARQRNEDIKLSIVLEMIGYYSNEPNSQEVPLPLQECSFPTTGNFIMGIANQVAAVTVQELETKFSDTSIVSMKTLIVNNMAFVIEGVSFSDHWSFWQLGYPALMLTDTAFLRNPHYHRVTDTWNTLNYQQMAEVVKGLAEYLKIK